MTLATPTYPCRLDSITRITPGFCQLYRQKAQRLARRELKRWNPRHNPHAESDELALGLRVCLTCPGCEALDTETDPE